MPIAVKFNENRPPLALKHNYYITPSIFCPGAIIVEMKDPQTNKTVKSFDADSMKDILDWINIEEDLQLKQNKTKIPVVIGGKFTDLEEGASK